MTFAIKLSAPLDFDLVLDRLSKLGPGEFVGEGTRLLWPLKGDKSDANLPFSVTDIAPPGDPDGTGGGFELRDGPDLLASGGGVGIPLTGGVPDLRALIDAQGLAFTGSSGPDVASGGKAPDNLFGSDGGDKLNGGRGDDFLFGGKGPDRLKSGAGDDEVFGGDGKDVIIAGSGRDFVGGGDGNDVVKGLAGNDVLFGEAGNDTIIGGGGKDMLYGGPGRNILKGGKGGDLFEVSSDDGGRQLIFGDLKEDGVVIFNSLGAPGTPDVGLRVRSGRKALITVEDPDGTQTVIVWTRDGGPPVKAKRLERAILREDFSSPQDGIETSAELPPADELF